MDADRRVKAEGINCRVLFLVLLMVSPMPAIAETPGAAWSLERVDLDIDLDPAERAAAIRGKLVLSPPSGGASTLDLGLNAHGREAIVELKDVRLIEPRERTIEIEHIVPEGSSRRIVRITPSIPFEEGERVALDVSLETIASSYQFIISPEFALASWVEHWYPAPADTDARIISSAAPGRTTLRMPTGWEGVTNGVRLDQRSEGNRRTEIWETETPMARSFAAGPLKTVEASAGSSTVFFHVLRRDAEVSDLAATIGRSIAALEDHFGPYPWPSLRIVEVPEDLIQWAASSEQGIIMVRSSVLADRSGAVPLFAHEGAHAWWGNRVRGEGPGAKLLTESLAQFGAVLAIEALEGRDAAVEFLRFSREGYNPLQSALGYFYMWRQGQDLVLSSLEDGEGHNLADSKGMWFYQMLRQRLGDERFFGILSHLLETFSDAPLTLEKFREIVIASAPADENINTFLEQWLDRTGAPVLRVDWWSIQRGRSAEVVVEQFQEGEVYALSLPVVLDLHDGSTVMRELALDERKETFRIDVSSRVVELDVDPDYRILLWRPEYGPPPVAMGCRSEE